MAGWVLHAWLELGGAGGQPPGPVEDQEDSLAVGDEELDGAERPGPCPQNSNHSG